MPNNLQKKINSAYQIVKSNLEKLKEKTIDTSKVYERFKRKEEKKEFINLLEKKIKNKNKNNKKPGFKETQRYLNALYFAKGLLKNKYRHSFFKEMFDASVSKAEIKKILKKNPDSINFGEYGYKKIMSFPHIERFLEEKNKEKEIINNIDNKEENEEKKNIYQKYCLNNKSDINKENEENLKNNKNLKLKKLRKKTISRSPLVESIRLIEKGIEEKNAEEILQECDEIERDIESRYEEIKNEIENNKDNILVKRIKEKKGNKYKEIYNQIFSFERMRKEIEKLSLKKKQKNKKMIIPFLENNWNFKRDFIEGITKEKLIFVSFMFTIAIGIILFFLASLEYNQNLKELKSETYREINIFMTKNLEHDPFLNKDKRKIFFSGFLSLFIAILLLFLSFKKRKK